MFYLLEKSECLRNFLMHGFENRIVERHIVDEEKRKDGVKLLLFHIIDCTVSVYLYTEEAVS